MRIASLFVIASLIGQVTCACAEADAPRNIAFILVDDQRHDALSCLGHPFLKTPAADSPVKGGVSQVDDG